MISKYAPACVYTLFLPLPTHADIGGESGDSETKNFVKNESVEVTLSLDVQYSQIRDLVSSLKTLLKEP